ncbi:hypothetical protein [Luteolibacter luteus]|uniref:Uncharacterized protein n=1 Tax=Luteolibacter luteus TaxID=2728835 RepID=A0A858RHF8_9BACT|nr:hypothetical protein [Luteolibacter luteus]QJE95984.1 hypothetical protein HHL09_09380 [Luteolibacter luteus]
MIILFIPGILNPAQFLREKPSPIPPPSDDEIRPHTAPYTVGQAHEIYRACVDLAETMEQARELESGPEIVWLVESLNGTAMRYGRKDNVPHARMLRAIELVGQTCRNADLGAKEVKQRDNWKLAESDGFNRLLPMILGVLASDEAEIDEDPAAEFTEDFEGELGEGRPLVVSTTETCVRLHHDGVGEYYEIELARIPDQGALLKWIEHVGGKTWVSANMIRMFVSAVCSSKGWKLTETSSL